MYSLSDVLDDEVAESVYRDRGVTLDMESVSELTADTFTSAVAQNGLTVVLFYVKCEFYVSACSAIKVRCGKFRLFGEFSVYE